MIKTKGTFIYTTKENPDQLITEEVSSAYQQAGLYQINLKDSDSLPSEFIYMFRSKELLIPDKKDEYGEMLYKKFEGKIISFEYTTFWEED